MNEFEPSAKPIVTSLVEVDKEKYMEAVENVTQQIKNGQAEKVVIARSVQMNFEEKVSSVAALHYI